MVSGKYLYLNGRGVSKFYGPIQDSVVPEARKNFYLNGICTTIICKPPHSRTLRKWKAKGFMKTVDGCVVKGMESCEHGCRSWQGLFNSVKQHLPSSPAKKKVVK